MLERTLAACCHRYDNLGDNPRSRFPVRWLAIGQPASARSPQTSGRRVPASVRHVRRPLAGGWRRCDQRRLATHRAWAATLAKRGPCSSRLQVSRRPRPASRESPTRPRRRAAIHRRRPGSRGAAGRAGCRAAVTRAGSAGRSPPGSSVPSLARRKFPAPDRATRHWRPRTCGECDGSGQVTVQTRCGEPEIDPRSQAAAPGWVCALTTSSIARSKCASAGSLRP